MRATSWFLMLLAGLAVGCAKNDRQESAASPDANRVGVGITGSVPETAENRTSQGPPQSTNSVSTTAGNEGGISGGGVSAASPANATGTGTGPTP